MSRQLSSGISVEEESPQTRVITGESTSILAALGITERGPHESRLITSFPDFQRLYGNFVVNGELSQALKGFYDNGGGAAYVKRVVHYTDVADALTKQSAEGVLPLSSGAVSPSAGAVTGTQSAPFALLDGATVVAKVDGGANATATFNGAAASRVTGNGPFVLANNQTLLVAIDGGSVQTIPFLSSEFAAIGAATPAEVAAVINAKVAGARADVVGSTVRLSSDKKGTGSRVDVSGGTANGVLGFATGDVSGTGNVANLAAVTLAEVKTVLEAGIPGSTVTAVGSTARLSSNTTGGSSSIAVQLASTARTVLGFDTATHPGGTGDAVSAIELRGKTDGAYANDLTVEIRAATSGKVTEFNLILEEDGIIRETWPNLSVDATSPNFHELVLNNDNTGSVLIKSSELVNGLVPAAGVFGPFTGGADGLSGISDQDFIGSRGARTGLHGFNLDEDARILICPDRETPSVHVAMVAYSQIQKKGAIFPVLVGPKGLNVTTVRQYATETAGLENLSEFGGLFWPNIKVLNPNTSIFGSGRTIIVSPAGHIAGAFARLDNSTEGGVYQAAAGIERGVLVGCEGFETDVTQEEENRDVLYPQRINPLRLLGGIPIIDGVRTLKGDGNFPSIPERRGVIYIEQTIKRGLEFARFRNNDADLRAEVSRTIQVFLDAQMRAGAFRSRSRALAYFIDVSDTLNSPPVVFAGKLLVRIGLATQKPAEFIVLRFSQDTRALQADLAAS